MTASGNGNRELTMTFTILNHASPRQAVRRQAAPAVAAPPCVLHTDVASLQSALKSAADCGLHHTAPSRQVDSTHGRGNQYIGQCARTCLLPYEAVDWGILGLSHVWDTSCGKSFDARAAEPFARPLNAFALEEVERMMQHITPPRPTFSSAGMRHADVLAARPQTARMASLPVLAILALVGFAEGSVGPSTNSSFCTESKECLEYELVCKTDEYEVRHYSPTRWVSTDAEAYFMGVGAAMAFRRLFQYITGANDRGIQMEMIAPVLVKIPEETKMWEPAVYTLNFPLPAAYQDNPPAPTNDKLYFTEMPDMNVYVRSYGGWMLSVTSRLTAHLLTKELERVRASYNHSYHYGVGYDSPLKLLNRHNEVWYVAEGPIICTDPQEPTPAHTPRPTITDSPMDSDPETLPLTLSDSPSLAPSDLSANTTSNSSAHAPSEAPALAPSHAPASPSSIMPMNDGFSHPPTTAQILLDPTSNSSSPASQSPSLEPQSDAALWNSTAHSSLDLQATNVPVKELDDAS
ncbi:uncharacterized protein V6R79_001809 [Siganus canaliculatus]